MLISVQGEFLLGLLNEVGSHRALTDAETDIIEDLVSPEPPNFRWNARHDRQLLTAANSKGGIKRFAKRMGMTEGAAYTRHHHLKKHKARKDARSQDRG